jgi:diketogulonate reductase-like aldo/keto reductase
VNYSEPLFIYGTAWKKEATERLVDESLRLGFHAIDTANQRKHYDEEGVGWGIRNYLNNSSKTRSDLFLQTKFTYAKGQDDRKPYDSQAPLREQVRQSVDSSLQHLQTDYLDSYLLHGPMYMEGISREDIEVWSQMEELYHQKKIRSLGIANASLTHLKEIYQTSVVKPHYVQNRCFAHTGWDFAVRAYCRENGIKYQGFSLLTANSQAINKNSVIQISHKYHKTIPQVIFRFCNQLGIICLTGTTSTDHMTKDLDIFSFELTESEMHIIEKLDVD